MPENIIKALMSKYQVSRGLSKKAISIAQGQKNYGSKLQTASERILKQLQAGYFGEEKKSKPFGVYSTPKHKALTDKDTLPKGLKI